MTSQKLYAILRKAGHGAAKWHASRQARGWGEWLPGVQITRDSDTYVRWLDVTYQTSVSDYDRSNARNVMQYYIVPALTAAGVIGTWVDEETYRVPEV